MTAQAKLGKNGDRPLANHPDEMIERENIPPKPDEPDESWWSAVLADEPSNVEQIDFIDPPDLERLHQEKSDQKSVLINWEKVIELFTDDEIVVLHVVDYNRGGVLVEADDIGGFVPVSHLIDVPVDVAEEERDIYLCSYLGRQISLKVIECEPKKERIVFSERAALAGAGQRKELLRSLVEGDIVSGDVTNITSFGIFVDLGGLEGLIHVSELSWGRVQHPSTILKVGDHVQTMVIQIFEDQSRIALSLKRLKKNPWDLLGRKLSPGDVVDAVISSIVKYGAFARLEEGIEGLIHISTMELPEDSRRLDEFLNVGQLVKVSIISIDTHKRRLGLKLESY
jgi:small subunit ribosomal protein S1